MPDRAPQSWSDAVTGRLVRRLSDLPHRVGLGYFRYPRHLPDGRMLAFHHGQPNYLLLDAQTSDLQPLDLPAMGYLRLRTSDGVLFAMDTRRVVFRVDLPDGRPVELGQIPDSVPGHVDSITCDGRHVILLDYQNRSAVEPPHTLDSAGFWAYVRRPRHGSLLAYDLLERRSRLLASYDACCPFHSDPSPVDPTLIRFALDHWEGHHQRIWAVRVDGSSPPWPIRPQQSGELVTHEFWWCDQRHIGFTYQDRRNDPSHESLPWCEYGHAPTRLGVADASGRQVYLSDPVNHYHTHLYCSFNGKLLSGSGTDGHSFVHAAPFDLASPRIEFQKLASIHTPYIPFRGQGVNCDFSADGRWLVYTDLVDGRPQLCAVKVDLSPP